MTKEEKTFEVIGVVADAKYNRLEQPAPPTVYGQSVSGRRQLGSHSQLAIRTKLDPAAIDLTVRQIEGDVLKNVPIANMTEMNDQLDSTIVPQRLFASLSAAFGVLGALLAVIGLYGLLAYTVTRRTHEIGVRVALGAASTDVMRIVLRDALWMVCPASRSERRSLTGANASPPASSPTCRPEASCPSSQRPPP